MAKLRGCHEPNAKVLDEYGRTTVNINKSGVMRIISARDEIEGDNGNGIAGIIPTQEILLQQSEAITLRNTLLEWYPVEQKPLDPREILEQIACQDILDSLADKMINIDDVIKLIDNGNVDMGSRGYSNVKHIILDGSLTYYMNGYNDTFSSEKHHKGIAIIMYNEVEPSTDDTSPGGFPVFGGIK